MRASSDLAHEQTIEITSEIYIKFYTDLMHKVFRICQLMLGHVSALALDHL